MHIRPVNSQVSNKQKLINTRLKQREMHDQNLYLDRLNKEDFKSEKRENITYSCFEVN